MPEGYYKHYDEYPDIINVDRIAEIPIDYDGVMGVPMTIVDNPIIAHMELIRNMNANLHISGHELYSRFFVRWIWTEQLQALITGDPLVLRGAYHSTEKWAEEHGIEMRIEK